MHGRRRLLRCVAWMFVSGVLSAAAGCAESPTIAEGRRSTRSDQMSGGLIPRLPIPRIPPSEGPPASGFGQGRRYPLPDGVVPPRTDPCDVERGAARGPNCSGNPGDEYVPARQCTEGEAGCQDGIIPGHMINRSTDPTPPYDPNLAQDDTMEEPDRTETAAAETDEPMPCDECG